MKKLFSQFAKPTGATGKIFGLLMAKENKQINRWTIDFLDIKDHDHIVEIGFGSGQAMEEILGSGKHLYITGIDPSEVMVYQALRRLNKHLINGQIQFFERYADDFPKLSRKIDNVLAINNVSFWHKPVVTLTKIYKQMNHGGRIALTLRPHEKGATDETTNLIGGQLKSMLVKAGFSEIAIFIKPTKPNDTVCAVGRKAH
ncbi:methyltransferase domain-containing protein [Virgibacillus dakarensis]|uniref:class I SAM-dependent methyltransferase n=1 Tax=Virgibacillus dakarensis TaxID=1917889 RepID=UPI000B446B4C|nr:class I SAM-dependent methyltransferase [Virgibacillus dakarensis]MTW85673.1 methyltransferase domain-containing protein [Virgibacillus dakarensis]